MKKYRLKKDFIFSRAGEEFEICFEEYGHITLYKDGIEFYHFLKKDIDPIFDEFFEEVKKGIKL